MTLYGHKVNDRSHHGDGSDQGARQLGCLEVTLEVTTLRTMEARRFLLISVGKAGATDIKRRTGSV